MCNTVAEHRQLYPRLDIHYMPLATTDQALMCMRKYIVYARSIAVGGSDDLPEGRNLAHVTALSITQLNCW